MSPLPLGEGANWVCVELSPSCVIGLHPYPVCVQQELMWNWSAGPLFHSLQLVTKLLVELLAIAKSKSVTFLEMQSVLLHIHQGTGVRTGPTGWI